MAIAFGSIGTRFVAATATTTYNIPYPSGIAAGHFLLLHMATNGGSAVVTPADWTEIHNEGTLQNPKGGLFYKIATGSESGNLAVTIGSAVTGNGVILRYTGVDTTLPIDASTVMANTTAVADTVIPSITTSVTNTMLIYANAINTGSRTISATTGTERVDHGNAGTGSKSGAVYDELRAATGATGSRTLITESGWALTGWGVMLALRPAVTAGPAYTASVALGGSGTLSAAAKAGLTRSVGLSGSGSLTTSRVVGLKGAASFGGSGVLTAQGVDITPPPLVVVPYVRPKPTYTAPYVYDAETRIRYSHSQIATATAYPDMGDPVTLDIENMSVSFSDSQAPSINAQIVCKNPVSKAVLDSLDSRRTFRVVINAGYVWNSVEEDVQLLADLHVRRVGLTVPGNQLVLECASDEGLMMDLIRMPYMQQAPQSNLIEFLRHHVALASTGSELPEVRSDYDYSFGAPAVAGLEHEPGESSWDAVVEAAIRAGVSVSCDSDRTWRIKKPQALSSVTALNFNTGNGGILTMAESVTSRDNFFNAISLTYSWRDENGDEHRVHSSAEIEAGPLSPAEIGYKTDHTVLNVPATQAQANAAAVSRLIATSRRGRSFVLESVNAFWLRPGMSVTATLPDGEQERLVVSGISFNFPSGLMSVRVRTSEDIQIIN